MLNVEGHEVPTANEEFVNDMRKKALSDATFHLLGNGLKNLLRS